MHYIQLLPGEVYDGVAGEGSGPCSGIDITLDDTGRCDVTQLVEDLHLAQVAGEDDAVNLIDHVGYLGGERNGYRQRPGAGWYRRSALCLDAKGVFRILSADTNMDVSG